MEFLKSELKLFLEIVKKEKRKGTYRGYLYNLQQAINYLQIDNKRIDISNYKKSISHYKPRTISKKISILRGFLNYLADKYEFKIIGDEPLATVETNIKTIPIDSIKKALDKANLLEYTIIYLSFRLGLKVSEISAIKLIDIKDDYICINKREIPLSDDLKDIINKFVQKRSPKKYLFEKDGLSLSLAQIRYLMKRPFQEIGLNITPTQIRHSFVAHLLKKGVNIKTITKFLGQKFVSIPSLDADSKIKIQNYKAHPLCLN